MSDVLFLAWHYLRAHRLQTLILGLAVALTLAIPASLWVVSQQGERSLTRRAEQTPILIGSRGSPLELVLNSLYFRTQVPQSLPFRESLQVQQSGLATAIPLYVRFRSQEHAIVGTTLDYFRMRSFRVGQGTAFQRLGDCVVGTRVARMRNVGPGDSLTSTPEQAFDVGGVYPLKMRVVGVLDPTGTPDDDAIFVDIKTAWVIEGLGHGHQDLTTPDVAPAAVLSREQGHVTAKGNAVPAYQEITDANLDSFHFHGDLAAFPITSVIAMPKDEKSATRLLGRYQSAESRLQAVEPVRVLQELLQTVVSVRSYALAALAMVAVVTAGLLVLIQALSLRLRERERRTLVQIGASTGRIRGMILAEAAGVLTFGLILAAALTGLFAQFGAQAVQLWLTRGT
ncbi:ABC transporter permease [Tuwongella immobilis]|uniref:MacB-like periplasmic core domain-containing protein n=1 Tax=Tuwongella immobilis TaxID=692036 RepID=A0A6C2YPU4_9BACT|nr:ABC transporter permease [Tuwongella immobilis]VIP03045.1 Uncharacterized protein OS=uncultured Desulfofustis sp. PB-SRB1 GN=N839_14460 PE=4 SV=1: MacB_PCD [Tuwongella immobilis]VTS03222.1 Uncharacterized protein OS=uncultured Desulfofustis sp. PB-SRB1 GN=N839_14460 PE=4 SV=1: MacB_PCD [Tuwongella immobilis]